jgi:membrane-associated phospholipid phosphatase
LALLQPVPAGPQEVGRYRFAVPKSPKSAALASLACVAALAVLVVLAYWVDPLQRADARLLSWFAEYEDTALGSLATVITFFVEPVPLLVILAGACAFAIWRGRPADAAAALVVVAGANLTTQALKHLLAYERFQPFLINQPDLTTFPSGHVTGAVSIVVALAWVAPPQLRRRVLAWGSGFVVAVGLSVLVLEWHFPSDVLGAIFVTGAWAFGVLAVYLRLLPRRPGLGGRRSAPPRPSPRAVVSTK